MAKRLWNRLDMSERPRLPEESPADSPGACQAEAERAADVGNELCLMPGRLGAHACLQGDCHIRPPLEELVRQIGEFRRTTLAASLSPSPVWLHLIGTHPHRAAAAAHTAPGIPHLGSRMQLHGPLHSHADHVIGGICCR